MHSFRFLPVPQPNQWKLPLFTTNYQTPQPHQHRLIFQCCSLRLHILRYLRNGRVCLRLHQNHSRRDQLHWLFRCQVQVCPPRGIGSAEYGESIEEIHSFYQELFGINSEFLWRVDKFWGEHLLGGTVAQRLWVEFLGCLSKYIFILLFDINRSFIYNLKLDL